MQEIERTLSKIHPATLTGALLYAALVITVGVAGSLFIRSTIGRCTTWLFAIFWDPESRSA